MTVAANTATGLGSRLVNTVLAIQPLANLAKHQARQMMVKRAEKIGVPWTKTVRELRSQEWESHWQQVYNPQLQYPEYYCCSFHAYEQGNLSWDAAFEVEVAARAVHAGIWSDAGAAGDAKLRQSYHEIVKSQLPHNPQAILDVGCSVGMSTFALKALYPQAKITGLDLSPYFLAVAHQRSQQQNQSEIEWVHAAAEATGLPEANYDLV
ncbi:class I SAM-dependent methyltransferase, partial [Chroococcidiopsidales cyanobacterium LEGE 13417]|nr:class I SAM-dependent methyltransferase [Chroococcidiopsidales cyanobacterium LEGE 13417]